MSSHPSLNARDASTSRPGRRALRRGAARHPPAHRSAVRRADGVPVARRHRLRAVGVAAGLGRTGQPHASARLGRGRRRRHHQPVPGAARTVPAGPAVDALHHRRRADADGRAAHPSHRRTHRDALSRLRLAGVPRVLSRLARAGSGDRRRRAGSHAARHLLAAVGLRRAWSRASGAGWSTRPGSSSKTSSSSSPAGAASWRCGRRPSARRRSSRRCARARRRRPTRATPAPATTRFSTSRSTASILMDESGRIVAVQPGRRADVRLHRGGSRRHRARPSSIVPGRQARRAIATALAQLSRRPATPRS